MGASTPETRSAQAWALARSQHGVVTRAQLLELGFSAKAINHRLGTGRLFLVARGVYLVGWNRMTPERRWMAAVLACGEGACLSHRSAAALWGIGSEERGTIDVTVRGAAEPRRPGIRARTRAALPADQVTSRRGIPLTTPIQTLIDLALEVTSRELERSINDADKLDLIDPDRLRHALDPRAGEPGVRPLRIVLDKHTFRLSDSELEVLLRPIAAAAGIPVERTKQIVNGFEVDFYWPSLRLVVETDGWRYHRTPAAQTRDARRDNAHVASGLTRLRFTQWQVKHEPTYVGRILGRTAANLRRAQLTAAASSR